MNANARKVLMICAAAPLLMAVLCEKEEPLAPLKYNETKVTITEGPDFDQADTLWISGRVSSMIFDEGSRDSVLNMNESIRDIISVMRLERSGSNSNTRAAIDEFEIIAKSGQTDFLGACPETELIAIGPLNADGLTYSYEIGLIAKNKGDFVLSWLEAVNILNDNKNIEILEQYRVNDNTNFLGLTKCGITYEILNVATSMDEYFFTVN